MIGLVSRVFFIVYARWWNITTQPPYAVIANQRMHGKVWLAESSLAPALWRHDWDVSLQNMMLLSIFQVRLNMFMEDNLTWKRNVNVTKSMPN